MDYKIKSSYEDSDNDNVERMNQMNQSIDNKPSRWRNESMYGSENEMRMIRDRCNRDKEYQEDTDYGNRSNYRTIKQRNKDYNNPDEEEDEIREMREKIKRKVFFL
jgi:hypothetical protein